VGVSRVGGARAATKRGKVDKQDERHSGATALINTPVSSAAAFTAFSPAVSILFRLSVFHKNRLGRQSALMMTATQCLMRFNSNETWIYTVKEWPLRLFAILPELQDHVMMSGPSEGIHVADVANPVYRFRYYQRWHVRRRSLVADIESGFGVDDSLTASPVPSS